MNYIFLSNSLSINPHKPPAQLFRKDLHFCVPIALAYIFLLYYASLVAQLVKKKTACNAGDLDLIPGSGKSPGEGNGNPLQYSCLENPIDRGAWQATVHGVARVGHNLVTKLHNLILLHLFHFTLHHSLNTLPM